MTEHESIQGLLALSAAGALDPGELRRVEQHAATCESCRAELNTWRLYSAALPRMPQPLAPAYLVARTQALLIEQHQAAAARRREALTLAALTVFGWMVSLLAWTLVRVFSGGALRIFGANLASGIIWALLSTALVWTTAAAAATVLGKSHHSRSSYEQV